MEWHKQDKFASTEIQNNDQTHKAKLINIQNRYILTIILIIFILQVDVFKIKAVYLGKLNQVLVGFKSLKKGQHFFFS